MDWTTFLEGTELSGYKAGGHGKRVGFGRKVALVVVDMLNLYLDPRFALGHGENTEAVIKANRRLIDVCREKHIQIYFSKVGMRASAIEKGIWGEKVGGSSCITAEADTVVAALGQQPEDIEVVKAKPSVFFGTQLAPMLYYEGVDTIIVTGVTTSGCVRATVCDGSSYNFRVIVPVECCGDRTSLPHKINLFDMDMKYADVMMLDEVLDYLNLHY